MAEMPLWLNATLGQRDGDSVTVDVSLGRCRNCGQIKVTSDPCSLDHLAALMEFGAQRGASLPDRSRTLADDVASGLHDAPHP